MQMPNISKYTKKEKSLPKRAGIVKMFIDKINEGRVGTKYPLIETKAQKTRMAIKLSEKMTGMSDGDLFAFYGECSYAKNFSAFFFWRFKK
jgi:hypothetical protein